jgi:electron transfer flavoprotein beta subunit
MNIIVCVKQIQDPEIPLSKFKLDAEGQHVVPPEGIPPVINPYDEQAVELAVRIKEKHGGKITVLTIGDDSASPVVKHALAMGADEGIILKDPVFEDSDSFATAYILYRAIQKTGEFDLVLCGRQAADWDEGLVGTILAEYLGLPLITLVESADFNGDRWQVKRVILDGHQIFAVPIPAVLTVSHELGPPRLPSGWGIITASKKEISFWDAQKIDADPSKTGSGAPRKKLVRLFLPSRERKGEKIEGEDPEKSANWLVEKLKERGVL